MKFFNKILVSIVVLALCVSALALSVTAADADNLEDILEYHVNADYLADNFESYAVDSTYTLADNDYFTLTTAGTKTVVANGENNQALQIVNNSGIIKYTGDLGESKSLVLSFRVYTEDGNYKPAVAKFYEYNEETEKWAKANPVNGCNLEIFLKCIDTVAANSGEEVMFNMMCHPEEVSVPALNSSGKPVSGAMDPNGAGPETYAFYYKTYDETTKTFTNTKLEGLIPQLQTWYSINAVFDFEKGVYEIQITPDGGQTVSTGSVSLGSLVGVTDVEFRIDDKRSSINRQGTVTQFDDLFIYQGSFLRDPSLKDAKTSEALLNLKSAFESAETIEAKVRVADILKTIADTGYVLPDTVENYDTSGAFYEAAKNEYIYKTYAEAFTTYVAAIDAESGYYNRKDYIATVERFADMFKLEEKDSWTTVCPGITPEDVEVLSAARIAYDTELATIARVRLDSNAFCELVASYDPNNKDYIYIKEQYEAIAHCTERDPSFRYAKENGLSEKWAAQNGVYVTLAEAEEIFLGLKEKKETIDATAVLFFESVALMKDEPVPMQNFGALYDAYVAAASYYNNGEFHPGLDNSTYEGLDEAIELFLVREVYVLDRVKHSEDFIYYVQTADTSNFYITKVYNYQLAARYIDNNTDEYTVEDEYAGVLAAREMFVKVGNDIATAEQNARDYLAAVSVVRQTEGKTFAQRKADVVAALALKEAGAVEGIEGVKEANIALYEAETYITSREGYSSTLITAVNALKDATDLAERRSLIYVANGCLENAEDSIAGVVEAKAALTTYITQYNNDVNAANAAFTQATEGACDVSSAAAAQSFVYRVIDVIKSLFN